MPRKKIVKTTKEKKNKLDLPPFVVLKNGAWYVKRSYPTNEFSSTNGKRLYNQPKARCIPETEERAKELAEELDAAYRAHMASVSGPVVRFKDLCERWLAAKKISISEAGYDYYSTLVAHLKNEKSELAERPFAQITTMEIQTFYGNLMKRGVSKTMIRKINVVHSSIFEQAIRWKLTTENPTKDLMLPTKAKPEVSALEKHEAHALLEKAKTDMRFFMFELALVTAMRPQEYLALKWSDIVWESCLVRVRRALVKGTTQGTKTINGRRPIKVSERFMGRLRLHGDAQLDEFAKLKAKAAKDPLLDHMERKGANYKKRLKRIKRINEQIGRLQSLNLIFPNSTGGYRSIWNIRNRDFAGLLKLARLEGKKFTPYSLRHTSISLQLAAGADVKSVSQRAGHASTAFTMDVYGHVLTHAQERTTAIIDEELYGE